MFRRLLALGTLALALAAPAHAGPPGAFHRGLGDDSLESEPRDVAGDLEQVHPGVPTYPLAAPLATPPQHGCTTHLIQANFSSRAGVKPRMLVAHFTVSANQVGWGDVDAIRSWFNQARAQASSHYIIDREGNCKLIVAETAKAWTQGAFNPSSISIEFIARGSESTEWWKTYKGLRVGARVFADASKRWDIPIRLVDPSGCTPRAGVTDHNRLECGNTHWDMGPRFPMAHFVALIKNAAAPPKPRFRFQLQGEEGTMYRTRAEVGGSAAEAALYAEFLEAIRTKSLAELREDGDYTVVRRKVD